MRVAFTVVILAVVYGVPFAIWWSLLSWSHRRFWSYVDRKHRQ